MLDRQTGAIELPGQANFYTPVPVGRLDLVNGTSRTRNTRVVNHAVETTEFSGGVLEHGRYGITI